MLILVLTDVQYSWKAVFSFKKGPNRQNHSSSGSLYSVKKFSPPVKFLSHLLLRGEIYPLPHTLLLFGKPWADTKIIDMPRQKPRMPHWYNFTD